MLCLLLAAGRRNARRACVLPRITPSYLIRYSLQMAWCTTNPPPLDPLAPGVADATDREAAFAAAS